MSDTPLLLAGLGNPGAEYARNRHNAGFMAADTIHARHAFGPWRARFALLADPVLRAQARVRPSLKLRTGAFGRIIIDENGPHLAEWDRRPTLYPQPGQFQPVR